ncbi:FGFR1 oncogene partner 2 homolog [Arctopsyche grandis]|uniref:FGFR1 oncogene partner 2 homolog n=1 Tax=Arctopsyche grandis TaxID=121162 RepID=UPI00406D8892
MSVSIHQIILDAKRLAGRLKERETAADALLSHTHAINRRIEAMKHYQEDIQALNEVASRQPHSVLISNSRELREMQQENQRLQIALDEHRKALEYIMSKYRQHVQWQIWNSRIDFQGIINRRQQEVIQQQADKINEMASVMHRAAYIDDENAPKEKELLSRLVLENKGLREMLELSRKYGTGGELLNPTIPTQDKDVQTDAVAGTST